MFNTLDLSPKHAKLYLKKITKTAELWIVRPENMGAVRPQFHDLHQIRFTLDSAASGLAACAQTIPYQFCFFQNYFYKLIKN